MFTRCCNNVLPCAFLTVLDITGSLIGADSADIVAVDYRTTADAVGLICRTGHTAEVIAVGHCAAACDAARSTAARDRAKVGAVGHRSRSLADNAASRATAGHTALIPAEIYYAGTRAIANNTAGRCTCTLSVDIYLAQAVLYRAAVVVSHDAADTRHAAACLCTALNLQILHGTLQPAEQTGISFCRIHIQAYYSMVVAVKCTVKAAAHADGHPLDIIKVNISFQRQFPPSKRLVFAEFTVDQQGESHQLICGLERIGFGFLVALVPADVRLDQRIGIFIILCTGSYSKRKPIVCTYRCIRQKHDLLARRNPLYRQRHISSACSVEILLAVSTR